MRSHGYSEAENSLQNAAPTCRLHFGLRRATCTDNIKIGWPSSLKQRCESLPANRLCVFQDAKGILSSRRFRDR
jgi:hypothetical protein